MTHTITSDRPALGPSTEIARNLFTNPSFETAAGTVEVRRNWGKSIAAAPAGFFAAYAGTTFSAVSDPGGSGAQVNKVTTTAAWGGLTQNVGAGSVGAAVGMPVGIGTFTARVRGAVGQSLRVAVQEYSTTSVLRGEKIVSVTGTGEWQDVTLNYTVTAGDSLTRVSVQSAVAGEFHIWAFSSETGETPGGIILPGYPSPDPDLTPSWTGTANKSDSVLTGVGVAGGGANASAVSIRSNQWASAGSRSLRMIPTGFGASRRWALSTFGIQVGDTFTVQVKVRLDAPQTGTIHPYSRRIFFYGDGGAVQTASEPAPNVPGVHTITFTGTALRTNDEIYLYGGATEGDVWWDDLIVTKGEYTGPYFDGGMTSTPNDLYEWTGTPHASISTHKHAPTLSPSVTSPDAVAGYDTSRESRNVISDTLDGGIGVAHFAPRLRAGTLTTVYTSIADAWGAYAMYGSGQRFAFYPDGAPAAQMHFVLDGNGETRISQDTDDPAIWYVDIDYQEVLV